MFAVSIDFCWESADTPQGSSSQFPSLSHGPPPCHLSTTPFQYWSRSFTSSLIRANAVTAMQWWKKWSNQRFVLNTPKHFLLYLRHAEWMEGSSATFGISETHWKPLLHINEYSKRNHHSLAHREVLNRRTLFTYFWNRFQETKEDKTMDGRVKMQVFDC